MRARALGATVLLLALAGTGCGGGDEGQSREPRTPELTVPGEPAADESPRRERPRERTTTEATTQPLEQPPPATTTPSGGAQAPTTPTPEPPADTPQNDAPPPSGSAAEKFEDFCDENPGAC